MNEKYDWIETSITETYDYILPDGGCQKREKTKNAFFKTSQIYLLEDKDEQTKITFNNGKEVTVNFPYNNFKKIIYDI